MQRTNMGVLAGVLALGAGLAGCDSPASPTADVPDGEYRSPLSATIGTGSGSIAITPVPNTVTNTLDMIVKVRVQGAKRNTRYVVQRAGEGGRANSADGVCQRAVGAPPWSPSDPPVNFLFPSFRVPDPGGPEVAFVTQANGNGSLDFEYVHPTLGPGIPFDMVVRVVEDVRAPGDRDAGAGATSELRSACLTVTGR
ncbi:MAG TPA: hypothetical protein VFM29_09555 [Vicinamibacteria bacterium]|nr:hypothetical protein [Vicinamibacteria bacterium]